jgi:hypothetical protein
MKIIICIVFVIICLTATTTIDSLTDVLSEYLLSQSPGNDFEAAGLVGLVAALSTVVAIGLCIFGAKKACKWWDWRTAKKDAQAKGLSLTAYALKGLSKQEILQFSDLYEADLKKALKPLLDSGRITASQYFLWIEMDSEEFVKYANDNNFPAEE